MALAIEEQLAELDADEVLKDFFEVAAAIGLNVSALEPGDIVYDLVDTFVTWFCNVWNRWMVPALRSQFLDYASGVWLRLVAWAVYNRPAQEATFGVGDVVLESRGVFVGTISAGSVRVRKGGKSYTNKTSAFMALYTGTPPYPTVTLSFQADEAGTGSNVGVDALPQYPTPLAAGPAGIYVQSNAAILASDEEAEPLIKRRCKLAVTERGNGPRGGLESVALDPIGALKRASKPIDPTWPPTVNITRVRLVEPGNGVSQVYLASQSGAAAGDAGTAGTDVFIANVALQALCPPPGGLLTVAAATEVPLAYGTIGIYVKRESNVTASEASAAARTRLTQFFRDLPIGGERKIAGGQGYVLIDHVRAVLMAGDGVFEVVFTSISTDQALAVSEVAVPTFLVVASLVTQGT